MALNEVMKNTADAIREKTGKNELIAPVNFAEEIKGITAGGGESASTIEYLDVSRVDNEGVFFLLINFAKALRYNAGTDINVMSGALGFMNFAERDPYTVMAIEIDLNERTILRNFDLGGQTFTVDNSLIDVLIELSSAMGMPFSKVDFDAIPRIAKEEFYPPEMSYKPGAYIQHIDGSLYTKGDWVSMGFSNNEANGVYASNGYDAVVIAKDTLGEMPWSSKPTTLIDGVSTTTSTNVAYNYKTGADDTAKIAAFDPDSAAAACANYTFPNGQKGYLPSVGEMESIYWVEYDIDELMTLIGGAAFKGSCLWTSLQYSAEDAWYFYFGSHDTYSQSKSTNSICRPVCAYIKNDLNA